MTTLIPKFQQTGPGAVNRAFSTTSVSGYQSVVNPVNLAASSTIGFSVRTNVATDWVGCLMGTIVLERLS